MIAALSAWHEQHEVAAEALERVKVLPGHAMLETYSVLTRLPGGLAIPAPTAAEVLAKRFPKRPLRLRAAEHDRLLHTLSENGIPGGASYDGLIALEAAAHGLTLLTLDGRAQETYRRLGVAFRDLGG